MNKESYKYEQIYNYVPVDEKTILNIIEMDLSKIHEQLHIANEMILNMGFICDINIDKYGHINPNITTINIIKLMKAFEIGYEQLHKYNYYPRLYLYKHYKSLRKSFEINIKDCIKTAKSNMELIQKLNKIRYVFYKWYIID